MANVSKGQAAEVQGDNRPTSPTGIYVHPHSGQYVETAKGQRGTIQGDALLRLGYKLADEKQVSEYRSSKKENLEDDKLEVEKEREAEAAQLRRDADRAKDEAAEAEQRAAIAAQGAENLAAESEAANKEASKDSKKSGGSK